MAPLSTQWVEDGTLKSYNLDRTLTIFPCSRFVTERTESRISIWFWGRKDQDVPLSVKHGLPVISTEKFGIPSAVWESSDTCDFGTVFGPENIVFTLTFCRFICCRVTTVQLTSLVGGEWAGQTPLFNAAGCPGTCVGKLGRIYLLDKSSNSIAMFP
jgi:hypothetical protein